jgi:hypothetical protein
MDSPAPGVKGKVKSGSFYPPCQFGQMYTTGQAVRCLKVSRNTLKVWETRGLRSYQPQGSRGKFYFAEDVMEFIRTDGTSAKPVPKKRKR